MRRIAPGVSAPWNCSSACGTAAIAAWTASGGASTNSSTGVTYAGTSRASSASASGRHEARAAREADEADRIRAGGDRRRDILGPREPADLDACASHPGSGMASSGLGQPEGHIVLHTAQVQAAGGEGRRRAAAIASRQNLRDPVRRLARHADLHERADDVAHHVVQETRSRRRGLAATTRDARSRAGSRYAPARAPGIRRRGRR